MEHVETFWAFSGRTYGKPGVAEACLALQDRYGLDVNMLLFCCWYGCTRGPLDEATLDRILSFADPWATHVVRPLRAVRTWMKATGCEQAEISESDCTSLRERIKQLELDAEKLQQDTLQGLVSGTEPYQLETESQLIANASNLMIYLSRLGIAPDTGSRTELARIVAAGVRSPSSAGRAG